MSAQTCLIVQPQGAQFFLTVDLSSYLFRIETAMKNEGHIQQTLGRSQTT
jgi:hypothetical protein